VELDIIWVATTRNRNTKLRMKSMSPNKVHVKVSNPMVSKVVTITSAGGKGDHVKMEALLLGGLAICFSIYISQANLVRVESDVGLDNSSIVRFLLSTSSHIVREVDQRHVIVVCILTLGFTNSILQRRLQDRFRKRQLILWLLSRKSCRR
jgi:hypothetical protein